jgi:hypothetical protein
MPGVELFEPIETLPILDRPLLKAHKQLPRRRDDTPTVYPSPPFRQGFFELPNSQSVHDDGSVNGSIHSSAPSTTIHNPSGLPLTPPSVPQEPEENVRSSPLTDEDHPPAHTPRNAGMRTPVNQRSPPTPDHTPPRGASTPRGLKVTHVQPSISSRAESFKTAREDQSSDDEAPETPSLNLSTQRWLEDIHPARQAEVRRSLGLSLGDGDVTPKKRAPKKLWESESFAAFDGQWTRPLEVIKSRIVPDIMKPMDVTPIEMQPVVAESTEAKPTETKPKATNDEEIKQVETQHEETKAVEPPLEEMKPVETQHEETKPVESKAVSADHTPRLKKVKKLRAEQNHDYQSPLHERSISLPDRTIPAATSLKRDRSLRERVQDSSQVHTLSTENFGDEIGWSPSSDNSEKVNSWRFSTISATSTTVEAMVIDTPPQRKRTLRHFDKNPALRSASSPIPRSNRTSMNSNIDSLHRLVHKTGKITNQNRWSLNSDISASVTSSSQAPHQPETIAVVVIPQRRSSLKSSASSSRRPSQSSGSFMSGSHPPIVPDGINGYFESPRQRRRTLSDSNPSASSSIENGRAGRKFTTNDPPRSSSLSAPTSRTRSRAASMTSDTSRLRDVLPVVKPQPAEGPPPERLSKAISETTNPQEWQGLRPPSSQFTPFSLHSVLSSSPGPVEISEATAVNLYPHNNESLRVVEKRFQPESRAVQELKIKPMALLLDEEEPTTPRMDLRPPSVVDSPLKNPREPPKPPDFKIIPPTPAAVTPSEEADRQLGKRPQTSDGKTGLGRRFNSVRRAFSARRYSDSFSPPFTRSLSLRTTARNRKKGEDLDSNLHPFWRPRGFWDDFSESDSDEFRDEDIIVNNSLGMPQKRIIFDGPLSLVRRISNPIRRPSKERVVRKTASYGSLVRSRLRPGKKTHIIPGLGLHFQFMGWKDWQYRILKIKERKEEDRREMQRERLRKSIGQHRVVQSDSRYV